MNKDNIQPEPCPHCGDPDCDKHTGIYHEDTDNGADIVFEEWQEKNSLRKSI